VRCPRELKVELDNSIGCAHVIAAAVEFPA
jgi:hypothetical protein